MRGLAMRRWWSGLIAGTVIATCGAILTITPLGLDMEKRFGLPWLFAQRGPVEPPPDIAVVAIDSTTGLYLDLPKLPRDWPRTTHAKLVRSLIEQNVSVAV